MMIRKDVQGEGMLCGHWKFPKSTLMNTGDPLLDRLSFTGGLETLRRKQLFHRGRSGCKDGNYGSYRLKEQDGPTKALEGPNTSEAVNADELGSVRLNPADGAGNKAKDVLTIHNCFGNRRSCREAAS